MINTHEEHRGGTSQHPSAEGAPLKVTKAVRDKATAISFSMGKR